MTEAADDPIPRVAVLTPVYNEEGSLPRYYDTVCATLMERDDVDFRVLFIDDGSGDDSWKLIRDINAKDERFTGVRLSRNFGPHNALSAGIYTVGDVDAVTTLACDLQDPPETILLFVDEWRHGAKIVWGQRRSRDDGAWRERASRLFHRLLQRFAMPQGSHFTTGSFLLMDRQVVECVRQLQEHNRVTFALVAWTGFDQSAVAYDRAPRTEGTSGWTLARMIKSTYDAFLGFSTLPIRVMTLAAVLAFLAAMLLVLYLVGVAATGNRVPGWTSQMLVLSAFFGVQFSLTAIIGEYLYRIYTEVVQRPLYFVSERTHNRPDLKDGKSPS